jgi:hypothetical protein
MDEKAKKKRRKIKKRRVSTRLDDEDVSVVNKLKDRHSRKVISLLYLKELCHDKIFK